MSEGGFLVEDFIQAITTQLDRVQDALRLKAVNRPLTYALKDLSLELRVFVEMDAEGNVRFRNSGPNETGASVVNLGFTTITKPMIEENTISMAATRSPSLQEMGLSREEQQRLERMGVRNAAQLNALGRNAGLQTVSRFTDLPLDRLRKALGSARPTLGGVQPGPVAPVQQPPRTPVKPLPPPVQPPKKVTTPGKLPVFTPPPAAQPVPVSTQPVRRIVLPAKTPRLDIRGANLLAFGGEPEARLNGRPVAIRDLDDDRLVLEHADGFENGSLEVTLPDGETVAYELSVAEPEPFADELGFEEYDPAFGQWGSRESGCGG